jgi:hypothetical protein
MPAWPLIDPELPQNRPALRIQTIAAHFLPRKFFALDQNRPQSGNSAKCCANRSRGSSADDCNIENFHSGLSDQEDGVKAVFAKNQQRVGDGGICQRLSADVWIGGSPGDSRSLLLQPALYRL